MGNLLLVGAGGFLGAILRYMVSGWVQDLSKSISFPYGTLAVNVIGCLLIGLLSYLVEAQNMFTGEARLFLIVGILGAFTTFSTFSNETFNLLREGAFSQSLLNIGLQVILGLLAVWVGRAIALGLWR